MEEYDEVFEDTPLFDDAPVDDNVREGQDDAVDDGPGDDIEPQRDGLGAAGDIRFNLSLQGDIVQPGRVYRLNSRLPLRLDLQVPNDNIQPDRVYRMDNRVAVCNDKIKLKLKRLSSGNKAQPIDVKKKKRKSKIKWFVQKLVHSKKPPPEPDGDQDPPPAQVV